MSAVAGIAGKAMMMLPKVASALPIAKGAWNIGKKVVGGIKNIFTGGKSSEAMGGMQGMVDKGKQLIGGMRDMVNSGRDIYQGFREGGLGGGIGAIRQQMPQIQRNMGGMMDTGRNMYQQGMDMYQQGRDVIQGGMNDMQNLMRKRGNAKKAGLGLAVMPG